MGYTDEPRKCIVDGAQALFHGFFTIEKPNVEDGKQVGRWCNVIAMIEFRNGSVQMVKPTNVRFLDGGTMFSQYDWGESNA